MNHVLLEKLLEKHRTSSGSSLSENQAREMGTRSGLSLREVYRKALEKSCVPLRYARNIGIFGISGQIELLNSRVLLVGCRRARNMDYRNLRPGGGGGNSILWTGMSSRKAI